MSFNLIKKPKSPVFYEISLQWDVHSWNFLLQDALEVKMVFTSLWRRSFEGLLSITVWISASSIPLPGQAKTQKWVFKPRKSVSIFFPCCFQTSTSLLDLLWRQELLIPPWRLIMFLFSHWWGVLWWWESSCFFIHCPEWKLMIKKLQIWANVNCIFFGERKDILKFPFWVSRCQRTWQETLY